MFRKRWADNSLHCSFCRKSEKVVGKLISSPSDDSRAYICDECIAVCTSIIEDDRAEHSGRQPESAEENAEHPLLNHPLAPKLMAAIETWIHEEVLGSDGLTRLAEVRGLAKRMLRQLAGDQAESVVPSSPAFPYETRLNILFHPLEVIDEKALADACEFDWYNQTLCKVNDSVVRLGVVQGEYHWHRHDEDDEFFYVVDGQLLIDLEDRTVELSNRQGLVVPKGVLHRTRAQRRTVILMFENAGIVPTGSSIPGK